MVPLGTRIGVESEQRRRLALTGNLMHWWDFKFVHVNKCICHSHLIEEVEVPVLLSVAIVWTISRLWSLLSLSGRCLLTFLNGRSGPSTALRVVRP